MSAGLVADSATHGDLGARPDIVDALGATRARPRHGCGTRPTSGWVRALSATWPTVWTSPADPVRVELTARTAASGRGASRRRQPRERAGAGLCLLVTQRRHRDDTALVADGPLADQWLAIAQASRGPGGGRVAGQFAGGQR